ncbi:biotin--[acetyl-CoA-carboxylase] ligase [Nostoc sp. CHAB 5824]|nr:biotin--[acetyl-CoA-carboxylase] ligase [Nostoc sp. CHAB 5824]
MKFKLKLLDEATSTNDVLKELARLQTEEGLVVYAKSQTAGRGQMGNSWEAEAGQNLTFSLLLAPVFLKAEEQIWLNMAICLALRDMLSRHLENVNIKWPNDIYVDDKKIAGLLIENNLQSGYIRCSIIGIGINVNQVDFNNRSATSFMLEKLIPSDLMDLLTQLLEDIEQRYVQLEMKQYKFIQWEYLKHLYRKDLVSFFRTQGRDFKGVIRTVDEYGRLVIETAEGVLHFQLKEVELLRGE